FNLVPTPSVPETRTGSSYGSDVSSNNPANAPIPPSTSGRFVFAICFFIRSTASYPFSTSTPAFLYTLDIHYSPLISIVHFMNFLYYSAFAVHSAILFKNCRFPLTYHQTHRLIFPVKFFSFVIFKHRIIACHACSANPLIDCPIFDDRIFHSFNRQILY